MYWDYHGDDLDSPLMTMLCRTHPVAIAGDIISYGYDRKERVFTLSFKSEKAGESIIYVHRPFTTATKHSVKEQYENGASLISFKTKAGEHTVKIKITDKEND